MTEAQEIPEEEDYYEHYSIHVDIGQELLRIDKFLVDRLPNTTRSKIQNAARTGSILVNGSPVKPNYKVKPHDDVSVVMPYPKEKIELIPEKLPLDIIHEDDDVIVLNKAPNVVVHPGYGNHEGTLVNGLLHHFEGLPQSKDDPVRPGLVHRLDKDTSGLMVVAKTEFSLSALAKQFFDRTTDRRYNALVWGDIEEDKGTITGHIGRSLKNRKVMSVFEDGEFGKHAVTHYSVIERFGYVTLLECKLETGRTHQIRAHFQHIGHPLFGDAVYGGDKILKGTTFSKYKQFINNCFEILPRQALHARSLAFTHPVSKERLSFTSELPEDMQKVLQKWTVYTSSREQH